MKATREDFENFLSMAKDTINDKDIEESKLYDYKDYSESLTDRDCWNIEEKLNNAIESLEQVKELLEYIK